MVPLMAAQSRRRPGAIADRRHHRRQGSGRREIVPVLKQPGETSITAKTTLVAPEAEHASPYLSPGRGRQTDVDRARRQHPDLDTAFAAQQAPAPLRPTSATPPATKRVGHGPQASSMLHPGPWSIPSIGYDEALGAAEAQFRNLRYLSCCWLVVSPDRPSHHHRRLASWLVRAVPSQAAHTVRSRWRPNSRARRTLQLVTDSQPT